MQQIEEKNNKKSQVVLLLVKVKKIRLFKSFCIQMIYVCGKEAD